jgi:hypothetical protein
MFSRCANPDCAAPFSYREGQLLRFQIDDSEARAAPAGTKSVRHSWLCKRCSETHRLEYHKNLGLLLIVCDSDVSASGHESRLIAAA